MMRKFLKYFFKDLEPTVAVDKVTNTKQGFFFAYSYLSFFLFFVFRILLLLLSYFSIIIVVTAIAGCYNQPLVYIFLQILNYCILIIISASKSV